MWLALLVSGDDPPTTLPAPVFQPRANVERLLREDPLARSQLDDLVARAERLGRPHLPRPANNPGQALRLLQAARRSADPTSWIGEYRGWYFFCMQSSGKPMLWFHGEAVRIGSRDVYHFGAW